MTDIEKWRSLKSGNRKALEIIYRDNFSYLFNYCHKITNETSLIEDCIQDLFVEIWSHREKLSDTDSIKKYLTVAIRRKVVRERKLKLKFKFAENEDEFNFDAELAIDARMEIEDHRKDMLMKLKKSFHSLSPRQKEIIYLKYYGGLDNKEIGEVFKIHDQSVRNLISRTLKNLSQQVKIFLFL